MNKILSWLKIYFGENIKVIEINNGFYFYRLKNKNDDMGNYIRTSRNSSLDDRVLFKKEWKDENDFLKMYGGHIFYILGLEDIENKVPSDSLELEMEMII
jgi:hypothetical protein